MVRTENPFSAALVNFGEITNSYSEESEGQEMMGNLFKRGQTHTQEIITKRKRKKLEYYVFLSVAPVLVTFVPYISCLVSLRHTHGEEISPSESHTTNKTS